MASHQAFNSMMEEFINELIQTFPEEKSIKVYRTQFEALKKTNSKKVVEAFMAAVSPFSEYITQKNEKILEMDIEFLKKLNIRKWWTPDLSQNTKDAIWQYLSTLLMLGTTITSIPSDMLKTIESVAEQCASGMDGNTSGMPDMATLFSGLQNMIGNMDNSKK